MVNKAELVTVCKALTSINYTDPVDKMRTHIPKGAIFYCHEDQLPSLLKMEGVEHYTGKLPDGSSIENGVIVSVAETDATLVIPDDPNAGKTEELEPAEESGEDSAKKGGGTGKGGSGEDGKNDAYSAEDALAAWNRFLEAGGKEDDEVGFTNSEEGAVQYDAWTAAGNEGIPAQFVATFFTRPAGGLKRPTPRHNP